MSPEANRAFLIFIDLSNPLVIQGFENCLNLRFDKDFSGACLFTSLLSLLYILEKAISIFPCVLARIDSQSTCAFFRVEILF